MVIDSQKVMYSAGSNDECYTPAYGVRPILEFLDPSLVVWCPFDDETSEFVKLIKANGNKVIQSHIKENKNFYKYEPSEHWDCIISNPPFTDKRKIFERAKSFNKPFALLMSLTWLNDSAPKQIFADIDLELLMFDKRIKYLNNGAVQKKITFSSAYYCYKFLPKQIVMRKLKED